MKIYLINGNDRYEVDAIFDGEVSETLQGEATLKFSFSSETRNITDLVTDGTVVEYNGQFYDVAAYEFSGNHLAVICTMEAEHVSYRLNNAEYRVESFAFGGTYAELLARILDGTGFTAGTAPYGSITGLVIDGVSRRELLMTAAEAIGCEVEYDGWTISFVEHRGSTERVDLMGIDAVTSVSSRRNVLTGEVCYTVTLGKRGGLSCGDDVHITYAPFGLDTDTRIIAIRYNPYDEYECSIDVGDYVPDIVDFYTDMSRRVLMKSDAKIEFEKYINSADGTAAISVALSGTYVTSDMLGKFVTTSELAAEVKAYINGEEGVASITESLAGTFVFEDELDDYATKTEVSTSITQSISQFSASLKLSASVDGNSSTITLTGNGISAVSATMKFSGFVTYTDLADAGSTTINGANITTGQISAERIDTSTLRAQQVYYYDEDEGYFSVLSSDISGQSTVTRVGPKDIRNNYLQALELYGMAIYFLRPGYAAEEDTHALLFDTEASEIIPSDADRWYIGTENNPFNRIYLDTGIYLYDSDAGEWTRLYIYDGSLTWRDAAGDRHTIV